MDSQTVKMISKVLEIFDEACPVTPFSPLNKRTKPIRLVMTNIETYWVPMLVCDFCGKGPVNGLSDDSCCKLTAVDNPFVKVIAYKLEKE